MRHREPRLHSSPEEEPARDEAREGDGLDDQSPESDISPVLHDISDRRRLHRRTRQLREEGDGIARQKQRHQEGSTDDQTVVGFQIERELPEQFIVLGDDRARCREKKL